MCEVLKIKPSQIGLNVLNLNYRTEEGDFTGYVTNDGLNTPENNLISNKMVINKSEVFAHEWIQFVESCLGYRGYALTNLMDKSTIQTLNGVFPQYDEIFKFKEVVSQKEESYSEKNFLNSVKSAAHFFERYALDSDNFYSNIEKISLDFENNFKNGKNRQDCIELFESSVSELLQQPHPTRYFSFLKAQCDLYIDKINEKSLEKNQFIDFAKRSDEYLQLGDYTQSTMESFARTFESYLYDKLKSEQKESSLVSSSYDSDFYPQSTMRTNLNDLWGKMWTQIKSEIDKVIPSEPNLNLQECSILINIADFRKKFNQDNPQVAKPKIG